MGFLIIGSIRDVQTFATRRSIRDLLRLQRQYGRGRWRKRKGVATVKLEDGFVTDAELHWYEATGVGKKEIRIKSVDQQIMKPRSNERRFAVCVWNAGFPASLQLRKVYEVIPDAGGTAHGLLRVIDESGEDYLYPTEFFTPIDYTAALRAEKLRRVKAALTRQKGKRAAVTRSLGMRRRLVEQQDSSDVGTNKGLQRARAKDARR